MKNIYLVPGGRSLTDTSFKVRRIFDPLVGPNIWCIGIFSPVEVYV